MAAETDGLYGLTKLGLMSAETDLLVAPLDNICVGGSLPEENLLTCAGCSQYPEVKDTVLDYTITCK